jgi:hypothetical protein
MRIKQFLLCFGIFAFFFCSCNSPAGSGGGSDVIDKPVNVPPRVFLAQNLETESFYQVNAELLAESKNCKVWAEKGSGVSVATANSMAKAYEDAILPKMLDTFGVTYDFKYQEQVVAHNTMELADWYGDGDGKLSILLLDIQDGYEPGVNDSYVAGYFDGRNFVKGQNSNSCDMIYIDTKPGRPGTMDSNATFAHEMQHMMNFVTSQVARPYLLDLWVDEGLSSAAEWLIRGSHSEGKWANYNQDISGLIQKGNNFFVWGNRENENQYALLDDYSTVYLFFQWLRLQAGTSDIYSDIITSGDYDFKAVTNAANMYMPGENYNDWGTLLKTWLAANYINAPGGPFGYKNDGTLKNIRAKTMPSGIKNVTLAPGEGVYSITYDFDLPGNKPNIRYAALNRSGNTVSDTKTFSGGALLTYNMNTNTKGGSESGTTTGVASYEDAGSRSALSTLAAGIDLSGPFAISASDMLRRNGFERKPFFEMPQSKKGITLFD